MFPVSTRKPARWYANCVSAAVYILSPAVFRYIPEGKPSDFVKDVFPAMLAARYADRPLHLIGPRYFPTWWRLLRLLLLFFCHRFCFFLVYILFLPVLFGTDFVALEELLHCVRLFSFRQVLDGLLVHLVVVEGHAEQAEMGRFLELAPEILDEIFENARILVEFQE